MSSRKFGLLKNILLIIVASTVLISCTSIPENSILTSPSQTKTPIKTYAFSPTVTNTAEPFCEDIRFGTSLLDIDPVDLVNEGVEFSNISRIQAYFRCPGATGEEEGTYEWKYNGQNLPYSSNPHQEKFHLSNSTCWGIQNGGCTIWIIHKDQILQDFDPGIYELIILFDGEEVLRGSFEVKQE